MRNLTIGNTLKLRAISGTHVVTLAWDFVQGRESKKTDLLGFSVEREEFENGASVEKYFLRGIKRFKHKDDGLSPGTPVPTSEHPVQSFQWGDYTAKPGTKYKFKVVPIYGRPKLLQPDDASSCSVEITTELQHDASVSAVKHDIFFNRGAAGSQAFARRFPNVELDENKPESEPMVWLSRGLFEALAEFVGKASQGDATDYGLRAMLYEFRYPPVGKAFAAAARAGADVDVRYEAQSYRVENEDMIKKAGIKRLCKPQKSRGGIRHNKFIVLLHKGKPIAVWTGSTNISAGGIFGHSNVGHVIWDPDLAKLYKEYWDRLTDPAVTTGKLKTKNMTVEPTPAAMTLPPKDRILTLFSPRDENPSPATLHWYADLVANAKKIACATFAFNLDEVFKAALLKNDDVLRYVVFDKNPGKEFEDGVHAIGNTVIAPGAKLEKGDLTNFAPEHLTGFNKNLYIHDKFLLIDPLGDDPIVVTGTANFSGGSQYNNDENMLVIRDNQRVSDIYFGEFMRIFDHLYSRYLVKKIKEASTQNPDAGYLKESWNDWVPKHFDDGPKKLRRKYFLGD